MTSKQALSIRTSMRFLRDSCSLALLAMIALGCGCVPQGGESDVPCIVVPEWGFERVIFREDNDTLLITEESNKSFHEVILRFDPAQVSFQAATEVEWEEASGAEQGCCLAVFEEGEFSQVGSSLLYGGSPVPVAGGVVQMCPSIPSKYVAVLSTDGRISSFNRASGQHFHQAYSIENGEQVGATLRLGVGGIENSTVGFIWTESNRFVIYQQILNLVAPAGRRVCVVDVRRLDPDQVADETKD